MATVFRAARLSINGRFLGRRPTGVDRFAFEVVRSIDQLVAANDPEAAGLAIDVLVPEGVTLAPDTFARLNLRTVPGSGQSWEQFSLPLAARGTLLLNLCNSGPLFFRNQVTVLHDAAPVSVPDAYTPAFRTWYRAMAPCIGRVARRVLTGTEFARREINRAYQIPLQKIGVVPESGEHILRATDTVDVVQKFGLGRRPYIFAVSSASRHKNFRLVIEAMEKLEGDRYDFVIAGGNLPIFNKQEEVLPRFVKQVGYVSDAELKGLFRNAACFVFPSLYEGYGLPPVEAMTLGCPVIASNLPSIREACGNAAVYISPHDPGQLADAMDRVMSDPQLRTAMRQSGHAQAGRLSWRDSALAILEEISPWLDRQ
ncbi:glycosyl transferase family 1 [Burkholderia ubonensis]|uniref:glycosyltransferase family 4 protein n=1 Tax=Burkholderia ubonensis TaxID=101571 RepID=UPI000757F16B|nr:glycosyltransferase family 1 protein [Burkholderia ubonensis]KVD16083.1 glycosyl transferase family 1 [Burkholderia ubonensis]KVO82803.1 glycosyl transferase family 1 [Burkholderia ubonensis]KVU24951.1 glycosyl transferase family 1 [Burkholderia ubonensis]KVZ58017.1 glycosyl transferase family 1 [Burkholderia ubonensis]KVZ61864.1 glycosyl transferase family 1 [Burkholderia ubonensis]